MSLCDLCKSPGQCCRKIYLYGAGLDSPDITDLNVAETLTVYEEWEAEWGNQFPFVLFSRTAAGVPIFTCPKLGNDGRCTIYNERPILCRDFEPASNELCVYYKEDC